MREGDMKVSLTSDKQKKAYYRLLSHCCLVVDVDLFTASAAANRIWCRQRQALLILIWRKRKKRSQISRRLANCLQMKQTTCAIILKAACLIISCFFTSLAAAAAAVCVINGVIRLLSYPQLQTINHKPAEGKFNLKSSSSKNKKTKQAL